METRSLPQFKNLEEEVEYLRKEISKKEANLEVAKGRSLEEKDLENVGKATLADYAQKTRENFKEEKVESENVGEVTLDLSPEMHDRVMEEILGILDSKGVAGAINYVEKFNDPHLEDDLHRFLAEFIRKGYFDLKREKDYNKQSFDMALYEINLPEGDKEEKQRGLKETISSMEQLYLGLLIGEEGIVSEARHIVFEFGNPNNSSEFIFFASVPKEFSQIFEKQFLAIFPKAKLTERHDDYNIFNEKGEYAFSVAEYDKSNVLPIKTYEQFDLDPLNVLVNSFSKIEKEGEGASIQIVFRPAMKYLEKSFKDALARAEKGDKIEKIEGREGWGSSIKSVLKEFVKTEDKKENKVDSSVVEGIRNKISSTLVEAEIRIIASSKTKVRAEAILYAIESSFNQFTLAQANSLKFKRIKDKELQGYSRDYIFRMPRLGDGLILNIKEISTVFHFPTHALFASPQLRQSKAATAPAPLDTPKDGILLGVNNNRNINTDIYFSKEDRARHFYVIGQTGTGKTTMLKNMIIQDIKNGDGVCMIDPHGTDIQDILANVPPERYDDIIYFDPSYTLRPMGLNMLEFDERFPDQKTFVVNEMLSIFNKLFDMKVAGGPAFEQYFRNSALLVLEHPESGCTLLDIARVLSDKDFRELKLSHCKNPLIKMFWTNAAKTTGEQGLQNYVPYITNKFDVFLSNDIMRPIVAQEKSSFNFRDIMDTKKIFLVNLPKGKLGDINASLLGLIIVGKILMAALSRVDSFGKEMNPFYLYIDEFQNFTTDSISTILSEARKYKLALTVAHQFIPQLEEGIKKAVFGNVGSMAVFRVGSEDAEFLQKQFEPTFVAKDIMSLDNHNAYLKMLIGGKPNKPFNIEKKAFPPKGDISKVDKLKELSYLKFGRDRAIIEEEIQEKYNQKPVPKMPNFEV